MSELNKAAGQKTSKKFYITNAVMLPEVKKAKALGRVTEELGNMFILITQRFARHPSFSGYTFREDMEAFAIANLCANGLKFDTERFENPFNYYTTAIYHSFLQYLAEEKKQRNIRDLLLIEHGANPSSTMVDSNHDDFNERHSDTGSDAGINPVGDDYHDRIEQPGKEAPKKSRNYGIGGRTKKALLARKAAEAAAAAEASGEPIPETAQEPVIEKAKSIIEY